MPEISLIAAVAENNAIGKKQELLCYLPNDLKHFKSITSGYPVIMGRKTFDSLPNGALPGRTNIVISRDPDLTRERAEVCATLSQAIEMCAQADKIFIIGGAAIYTLALPMAQKLYITHIHHNFEEADTFFPDIPSQDWKVDNEEFHAADDKNRYDYTFSTYVRR